MVHKFYEKQQTKGHIWQRGYYEHILRNQQDFDEAAGYIAGNPVRRLEREGFL